MAVSNSVTVAVQDLSKTYHLGRRGLAGGFLGFRGGATVEALKKVSFVAHAGESIGVLGKNGSGKSTLLNLVAGNETPSHGRILVSSQPTLLGVSAALQPHLSGLENTRLGLLAMGLSPSEVRDLIPGVIEWADVVDAADRPLRTYSSGMQARLKFSIATAVRREILLVDEALSTGDSTFARKAKKRMSEFLSDVGTVFIVSHASGAMRLYCNRVLWVNDGEIISDTTPDEVAVPYLKWTRALADGDITRASDILTSFRDAYNPPNVLFDSEAASLLDDSREG